MAKVPISAIYLGRAGFKKSTFNWHEPFYIKRTYEDGEILTPAESLNKTSSISLEGSSSMSYTWVGGVDGDNGTDPGGGIFNYTKTAKRGDRVFFQQPVYYENGYSWDSELGSPHIKFMRVKTESGHLDIYYDRELSQFKFIYEGGGGWSYDFPADGPPPTGRWVYYQIAIQLDTIPKSSNGEAEVWFWRDGQRLAHITDKPTLASEDNTAHYPQCTTFWNGNVTQTQTCYFDSVEWTNIMPSTTDSDGWPRLESATNA